MNRRVIRAIAIAVIFISCFFSGAASGFILKTLPDVISAQKDGDTLHDPGPSGGIMVSDKETMMKPFWEAWDILHEYYVDQPIDDSILIEGAIKGLVDSLGDPHTRYSDKESFQDEQDFMEGQEYEGIGAWVDITGDYVQITSPMKGSPADKAGLRPKDLVIAIDGEDMTGIDPDVALDKILGPKDTQVVLTIKRGDQEPFDVSIIRDAVITPMIISEMREDGVAVVQLTQFGDLTTTELKEALADLMPQNPKGLVLDLRNNGGGYVDVCVEVASEFLPRRSVVLIEREGDGKETEYKTSYEGRALDIPMVVLGNEGTASASEILIGALQYYDRALFVGVRTFGKGSMQIQPEISNGGAVSVTIARWLTPAHELIHGSGITPDIDVQISDEDYENNRDPQLDKAVQLILDGVTPQNFVPEPTPTAEPSAEGTVQPTLEPTLSGEDL